MAAIPCFNSQADALEHNNSITRCVTILTISFVVLISTTYYQSLLLSSFLVKDYLIPPMSIQELVQYLCWLCKRSLLLAPFAFKNSSPLEFIFKMINSQADSVEHDQWTLMFPEKYAVIENHLRAGVEDNQPIADVLQMMTPLYLVNLKTDLMSTLRAGRIVYFTDMYEINTVIKQMSEGYIRVQGPFFISRSKFRAPSSKMSLENETGPYTAPITHVR